MPGKRAVFASGIGPLLLWMLTIGTAPAAAAGPPARLAQKYNLRAGTEIPGILATDIDARMMREGQTFVLRLSEAVGIEGQEVLPKGAEIHGRVAAWQDQDGNYAILVMKFETLKMGMATLPLEARVTALEPARSENPSMRRTENRLPEMSRRPPGDPRDGPLPQGQPYPPPDERDPDTGERRRPATSPGTGVSMRRLPADDDLGKPSAIGLRRENVANMKVSVGEEGDSHISIENADIAIRGGTRFRLILTKDLSLQR